MKEITQVLAKLQSGYNHGEVRNHFFPKKGKTLGENGYRYTYDRVFAACPKTITTLVYWVYPNTK